MKLAIIGQSHAVCVHHEVRARRERLQALGIMVDVLLINDPRFSPWKRHVPGSGLDGLALVDSLRAAMAAAIAGADGVFSMTGGMAHNIFGLVNHARPFDFVLPENPGIALESGREVVPVGLIRQALAGHWNYRDGNWFMRALGELAPHRVVQCESPPPIREETWIRERAGVFTQEIAQHGVTPGSVRLKMWRLQSAMVREQCEAIGIGYLPTPPDTRDESGFLDARAVGEDAVHANTWYGHRVLVQMINHLRPGVSLDEGIS